MPRLSLLLAAFWLAFCAPAYAERPINVALRANPAAVDLNFATSRFKVGGVTTGDPAALPGWSFTRASTGYAETSDGRLIAFASGVPRITDKGLLVETARTNGVRNSSASGAVVGTPGVLPTNWSVALTAGGDGNVVGTGVEDGIPYVDIQFFGTSTLANNLAFDVAGAIPASTGQVWTASLSARLVAGTLANISTPRLVTTSYNVGGSALSALANVASFNLNGASLGVSRQGGAINLSEATVTSIRPLFYFNTNGGAFDFTLRIGIPQLELGTFATSPIITTGTAATRASDLAFVTGLGSILTPPFTMAAQAYLTAADGVVRRLAAVSDGTADNRVLASRQGDNTAAISMVTAGGTQPASGVASSITGSRVLNISGRVWPTSARAAVDGVLLAPSATLTAPAGLSRLDLGQQLGLEYLNGYVQRVRLLGDVSDGQLQAMTQ